MLITKHSEAGFPPKELVWVCFGSTRETEMKSLELEQYLAFLDAFRKVLIGLTVWQLKQEALF